MLANLLRTLVIVLVSFSTRSPSVATDVAEGAIPEQIQTDWALQDGLYVEGRLQIDAVRKPLDELSDEADGLRAEFDALLSAKTAADDPRWTDLYHRACERRRADRLTPYLDQVRRVVFTKHYDLGGSHYAYTEGQSDAQAERHFKPGTALCVLEIDGFYGKVTTLIEDPAGVIRDPDVSWDGKRILFAWKKSDRLDDYHLHEIDVATRKVRQLTYGLGFADYEPAYLPNGDLLFTSTRCVQIVDCWWTEVSNFYTCDKDGKYLRRLSHDQVHTNYPTITPDGRVIYTRWDYSDRGQIYPQGLFQMNSDGTSQREFYGNNSWFPTTIAHARAIPGTQKVVAIFTGHHTHQRGWLGILDPGKGRQENAGAQLIAPIRETPSVRIDAYGQSGAQFQYPYPIGETAFLVTMDPIGAGNRKYPRPFAIYWIDIDGRRELLATDPDISCNQPVPLRPRPRPPVRASTVDYTKDTGVYYVQDVYAGPGLAGVPRGTIEKLRVVSIDFRAAGIGSNGSRGPAGGAMSSTPVSVGNGCWDPKIVLGNATVHEDGSACFVVPALTPVYFQAIDDKGHAVQTMRSWSTLQPGETFSCVGCHETRNGLPLASSQSTTAMRNGPQELKPFYGPPRGFSFAKEIQPILDKHCVGCHDDRSVVPNMTVKNAEPRPDQAFSLLGETVVDEAAKRRWSDSYLMLTQSVPDRNGNRYEGNPDGKWVKWISVQSEPNMLPPYHAGAAKSPLITLLDEGHEGVTLAPEEKHKIAAWIDLLVPYCGDYTEANTWNDQEKAKNDHFYQKRTRMSDVVQQNIAEYVAAMTDRPIPSTLETEAPSGTLPPNAYRNVALTSRDASGEAAGYPRASSNSECRNEPWFAASCAIDGKTANRGHGRRFPSWGPDKRDDVWWKVEFGRAVQIDKLVLYIRADFPHDKHWDRAVIEFSDGHHEKISIAKTAEPQVFTFAPRTVTWLRLTNLVQDEPLGWCALTEVELWGRDAHVDSVARDPGIQSQRY